MRICILGTGYVGLTTGVCLGFLGHDVACLDTDERKIGALRRGECPIYEPGLEDLMQAAAERLRFTADADEAMSGAEVVFIAVGTPPLPTGEPDLRYLRSAAEAIGERLGGAFTVVVNKSTVPIGSGNWVDAIIREAFEKRHGAKGEGRFAVASNPEFLREGAAIGDSLFPDRIVVGSDSPQALEILYRLYLPVVEQKFAAPAFCPRPEGLAAVPLVTTDLASAELIKYAANAFLALKISYINEIGWLAERVGADIAMVAKGIGLDARIGPRFLQAGIGWGGSCFGKDTSALIATASEYGLSMPIVSAAREVNRRQRERVLEKLLAELKILKGRTVGLLGLAFKPQTDDLRDAPALEIATSLLEKGCRVVAHDPVAMDRFQREFSGSGVKLVDRAELVAEDADAVVLVTDWSEYRDLDWAAMARTMRAPLVLDGRNLLDAQRLAAAGLKVLRIAG